MKEQIFLKNITISNFKGFGTSNNIINLSIPNGKLGSGLNVIVGANNSGKSTIIQSILKLSDDASFNLHERRTAAVNITFTDSNDNKTILNNSNGISRIKKEGDLNFSRFIFIHSKRIWRGSIISELSSSDYDKMRFREGIAEDADNSFAGYLASIRENDSSKATLNNHLAHAVPGYNNWTIDQFGEKSREEIVYLLKSKNQHPVSQLGDGVKSLFQLFQGISRAKESKKILIIDEPELSLHPQAQKYLAKQIIELSSVIQVILATHSPHFIDWKSVENGGTIFKVGLENEEISVHSLNKQHKPFQDLNNTINWQKPQLLDAVAKEIFFSNKILFTEGQSDVGIINSYLIENNIEVNFDIFGYGCGGANNICNFLSLAKHLNIKSLALFDYNKKEEAKKCELDYPESVIRTISTNDIVDKKDSNGAIKHLGLFYSDGTIKVEHKNELDNIIQDFNK